MGFYYVYVTQIIEALVGVQMHMPLACL